MSLRPCAGCGRHVRESEQRCPFCATAMTPVAASSARSVPRLGRAALFAFGAATTTVAVASAEGCTGSTTTPDAAEVAVDGGSEDGGPTPLYGGPPDAATEDSGNVGPAYGAPPDDAGSDAGLVAMYGGPPPPDDAGVDAAGGVAPLYGGSPGA